MRCFKLIKYDLKQGILKNRLYLLVPLSTVIICNQCRLHLAAWDQSGTWAIYLAYCFRGLQRISRQTLSGGFQIPVFWVLMLVLPLTVTLDYPFRDIKTIGPQMLVRSGRRVTWWLSKCFWNLCSTIVYFALVLFSVVVFCFCLKVPISMETPMGSMMALFSEADITEAAGEITAGQVLFVFIIIPFSAVAALNMEEMLFSLIFRPIYGFLFSVALVTAASYVTSPFLIGNYANVTRCDAFIDNGLNSQSGLLICIGVLFVSIAAGALIFRSRDILLDYKEL